MSNTSSFADFLNTYNPSPTEVAGLCIDLVGSWAGDMDMDEIYSELISNAKDTGAVDLMLYQLEGDPVYAENVALLILSSAWTYPELAASIRQSMERDEVDAAAGGLDRSLALADLYGMYLLARNDAKGREVAYRDETGAIQTHTVEREFPVSRLFDWVREQYAEMM